jgi:hypothetical protein
MKKALLVVAMLLAASQVMAGVTITATQEGTYSTPDGNVAAIIRVDYTGDINVRAFALDLNIDMGGNFWSIRNFKVGENNGTNNGYGIFPGRFRQFINPANPAWGDANGNSAYNPTPPWADPGTTNTGIGFATMIVEMGFLGATDANKPPQSGTLFRVDINGYATNDANLTITADTMRGGVVSKDTNATTTATNLPYTTKVVYRIPVTCVTPTNEVGQPTATALSVWAAQGFTNIVGTPSTACPAGLVITNDQTCINLTAQLNYTYGVAPAVPNVVGMTRAAARTALTTAGFVVGTDVNGWGAGAVTTVGNVYASNPAAGATPGCGATVVCSVVSYPIKDTATTNSFYANWVGRGKPACWAYPRQCHGDIDGKKLGNYWVSGNDLTVLRGAISKAEAAIPPGGICAALTHKKLGNYWVSGNDLTIIRAYISKAEASVPVCGTPGPADPNFWYFCIPTGATCPAGVTCAPAATCPNTP